MNHEHKKMVTWIDYQHDPNRIPKPNTLMFNSNMQNPQAQGS